MVEHSPYKGDRACSLTDKRRPNLLSTEQEKRLHRCCFTGHRPEKLYEPEGDVKAWLETQIDLAIADDFVTFISGCAMGVDIWAAEIVLRKKADNPAIHLIAATPWPGFARRWNEEWKAQYDNLLRQADLVVNVCNHYHQGVFQQRNCWMVDHSSRVIAYYNRIAAGGTKNTIDYALTRGVQVMLPDSDDCINLSFLAHPTDSTLTSGL